MNSLRVDTQVNSISLVVWINIIASVLTIPYIHRQFHYSYALSTALYSIAILLEIYLIFNRNTRLTIQTILFTLWIMYNITVTTLNGVDLSVLVLDLIPIISTTSLALALIGEERDYVYKSIIICYTILLLIDIITELVFKNGMYVTVHKNAIYYDNWFLGYKTARVSYTLPLLVCNAIMMSKKNDPRQFLVTSIAVIIDTYLSKGTTALLGVFFFIIIAIVIYIFGVKSPLFRRASFLLSPKVFFVLIAFLWFTVVILQNNDLFFRRVLPWLGKSNTLTGRTAIWEMCLQACKESNYLGIGMVDSETVSIITNGSVNAHSQYLTLLLQGGIPTLLLYISLFFIPMSKAYNYSSYEELYYIYIGIYSFFIIGLVSSSLVYTPLLFLFETIIDRWKYYEE